MRKTDYITALRFPLALLVVLIHSYNSAWQSVEFESGPSLPYFLSRILPTFAVPLFFAISGYLFFLNSPRLTASAYANKLNRRKGTLLLPYLLWNLIAFGLYALKDVFSGIPLQNPLSFHLLWDSHTLGKAFTNWAGWNIAAGTAPVQQPLWFVRDLMILVLLSPVIYVLLRKLRIFGLLLLGIVYYGQLWPNFGGITFQGMWFFGLGAWFSISQTSVLQTTRRLLTPAAVLVTPLALFLLLFPDASTAIHSAAQELYVLCAMVCAIELAQFYTAHRRPNGWLAESSFFLYASHTIILLPLTAFFAPWTVGKNVLVHHFAYLLCPILAVMFCLLAYYALRRFFPSLHFLLTGVMNRNRQ